MGEADRYQEYKRPKTSFRLGDDGNALVALFALNVIFFLLILLIQVGVNFSQRSDDAFYRDVVPQFAIPGSFAAFIQKPWTIITYMFGDIKPEIIRLLSNMLWLWAFGSLMQQMGANSKMVPVYLYGGLAGGLFFILAHYIFPSLAPARGSAALLGANTGVMAIAVATTTMAPGFRFFQQLGNGIPIWVLTAVYILIDLAGIGGDRTAYSIAHLAAGLAGFLFVILLNKGKDGSIWMHRFYGWITTLFEPGKKKPAPNLREKIFYETGGRKPFHKTSHVTQQRIDEILDKINQKGYDKLTEEEKLVLKKASEDGNL